MGYDREATDQVFASLAASYEQLWHEHESVLERLADLEPELGRMRDDPGLSDRVAELEAEVERLRADEPLLRDALVDAHRIAKETVDQARREAEAILARARAEAEELTEAGLDDLRAQQEHVAAVLDAQRLKAEEELKTIRHVTRSTQSELSSFLRHAIDRVGPNGDGAHAGAPDADLDMGSIWGEEG